MKKILEDILKNYIKTTLECESAEAMQYNISTKKSDLDTCIDHLNIFYAENERDFLKNIIIKDVFDEINDIIDKLYDNNKYENYGYSQKEIENRFNLIKNYFGYKFQGKGFYNFKDYSRLSCETIDKFIKSK